MVAVTSYVGSGSPRFYLPLDVQTPNLNLGELMVMTKGGEARERVLAKIQQLFDNGFPLVRGRVNRLENGPPVGYPLQFRVFGPGAAKVRAIAEQVAAILRADPHVRARQPGLGRAAQARARRRRPGQGAPARHQLAPDQGALQGSLSGTTHHAVPRGRQGHRRGGAPDRSPSAPTSTT